MLDVALVGFRELRAGRAGRLALAPTVLADRAEGSLLDTSRVWQSATPYVVTRHANLTDASAALVADVVEECRRLALPTPIVEVRNARGVPGTGLIGEVRRTFRDVVPGPLLMGRTRYFGGGLFRPAT